MKKLLISPLLLFIVVICYFYKSFFFFSLLPIPSDTIIGLYHPFRDLYSKEYPRGVPYKNSLITDPVVQQLPWRYLSVDLMKNAEIPLWNPYAMAGVPLLANIQTASLYPLNILFFLLPFAFSWSVLIILQQLLGGVFLYYYLKNRNLDSISSLLGSFAFSFSGFFIAWLEWGTVVHTLIWAPLILLCIDKFQISNFKYPISKKTLLWSVVYILALSSSFLAGHLQTFIYVFVLTWGYFIFRWFENKDKRTLFFLILYSLFFILITSIQWIPTLQLILLSARNIDLSWTQDGWFIPWGQLIQFIVPDYFGNPATGNYFGVWNYAEFVGYVGIIPLLLAGFALFQRKEKDVFFWGLVILIGIVFSTGNSIGKLPYLLNIPFLSSTQPTRLLAVVDLALAILSSYGLNFLLKKDKNIMSTVLVCVVCFLGIWGSVVVLPYLLPSVTTENIAVTTRNLILPSFFFLSGGGLLILISLTKNKVQILFLGVLFIIMLGDLFYFANKFTPFTKPEYLFPQTKILTYLQDQKDVTRIMTTDSRILPPNFSLMYRIQSVDGYDPLYLMRYGELIAASGRNAPNIKPPFGFSRIIRPHDFNTRVINLLGVRYILSLETIDRPEFVKVAEEGQTKLYLNPLALSRTFFVTSIQAVTSKQEAIQKIFDETIDLKSVGIVEDADTTLQARIFSGGSATIATYTENKVSIQTENKGEGFLVLVDTYYPGWHAYIDGVETKIYRTDYHFRGIVVPAGKHRVEYKISLL